MFLVREVFPPSGPYVRTGPQNPTVSSAQDKEGKGKSTWLGELTKRASVISLLRRPAKIARFIDYKARRGINSTLAVKCPQWQSWSLILP